MDKPIIILDGDLGPDPCDFATLAMAHILHRKGKIELKGVIGTLPEPYLAPALDYFRKYYGNTAIPIGVFKPSFEERYEIDKNAAIYFYDFDPSFLNFLGLTILSWAALLDKNKVIDLVNEYLYSKWPATRILCDLFRTRYHSEPLTYDNAIDGADLYKQILRNASDNSITLLVVGQLYNLKKLLGSSDGKALVEKKVNKIIMMIGSFECKAKVKNDYRGLFKDRTEMWAIYGTNNEFGKTSMQINDFMKDANYRNGEYNAYGFIKNLSKDVFELLTQLDSIIKIYLLGNEEGFKIPAGSLYQDLDHANPVKMAYLQNYNGNPKGIVKKDPAYDELALYYLAYGNEESEIFEEYRGDVAFDDRGKSTFTDNPNNGRFYRIVVRTSVKQESGYNETRKILSDRIEQIAREYGGTAGNFLCVPAGLITDRSLLSCTSDGTKVDLWNVDDGSGRQSWEITPVAGYTDVYNIKVAGGISSNRVFLSCTSDGTKVDLWNVDDGSGRQRWKIAPVAGYTDVYNVKVAGGISNNRVFLSCTSDGTKVDLWHVDDGSGRQRWKMPTLNRGAKFLCVPAGLTTDRSLLSCTADGTKVDLWHVDDGSGRQSWEITPVAGYSDVYNIKVAGGYSSNRVFLSCTSDGTKVDLWNVDDGSGRQRWKITPVAGYTDVYNVKVAGGISNDRVFLSCTSDGTKVDLWNVDDSSGRQRWLLTGGI